MFHPPYANLTKNCEKPMQAPISVIIPTLNAAERLGPCLGALSDALTQGLLTEVIFADGGSSDDTSLIAEEVGAVFLSTRQGRGSQMGEAAAVARGEWLLFLHADSVLETGWTDVIVTCLREKNTAGYFRLRFDSNALPAKIVARWANFRAKVFHLPYGDQGLLISRKLYDEIGGFPDIPLMEDVEIAKKLGKRLAPINITITTSAEKYIAQGWLKRSMRNFWILMRYKFGANPVDLAKNYT